MRGTALALAFLALLIAAGEGRGEGNTVKLCGRDFVRAVVFTCGGSRWKRHVADYRDLFESDDPLPFSRENNGYTDPLTYSEQRPGTDSEEITPGTARDSRHAGKTPVLRKRDAAKLLPTSCCSVGCSEREISSLC